MLFIYFFRTNEKKKYLERSENWVSMCICTLWKQISAVRIFSQLAVLKDYQSLFRSFVRSAQFLKQMHCCEDVDQSIVWGKITLAKYFCFVCFWLKLESDYLHNNLPTLWQFSLARAPLQSPSGAAGFIIILNSITRCLGPAIVKNGHSDAAGLMALLVVPLLLLETVQSQPVLLHANYQWFYRFWTISVDEPKILSG